MADYVHKHNFNKNRIKLISEVEVGGKGNAKSTSEESNYKILTSKWSNYKTNKQTKNSQERQIIRNRLRSRTKQITKFHFKYNLHYTVWRQTGLHSRCKICLGCPIGKESLYNTGHFQKERFQPGQKNSNFYISET